MNAQVGALNVRMSLDSAQFQTGVVGAEGALQRFDRAARTTSDSTGRLGGAFSRLTSGGQIQNAAFQLGDFAVQVGNGTKATTALSQQLPQLLGGFGVLGAVLGAAAAIALPLGAALFSMGDASATTKEKQDDLSAAVGRLREAMALQRAPIEELISVYGRADEQIRTLAASMAQIEVDQVIAAARALKDEFSEFTDLRVFTFGGDDAFGGLSAGVNTLTAQLGLTVEQAESLQSSMLAFEGAGTLEDMAAAAYGIAEAINATRDENGQLTAEMTELLGSVISVTDSLERARGATSEAAAAAGDLAVNTGTAAGAAVNLADTWLGVAAAARQAASAAAIAKAAGEAAGATSSDAARRGVMNANPTGAGIVAMTTDPGGNAFGVRPPVRGGGGGRGGGKSEAQREAEREAEEQERNIQRIKRESWREHYREMDRLRREEQDRIAEVNQFTANSFADMFAGAITGAQSLRDSVADLVGELGKMALQQGFMTLLTGGGFGQSAAGGFLSSIFGIGARANGGSVAARRPYLVGERGPELFVPGKSGAVIPNHAMSGGGAPVLNFAPVIDARGADQTAVNRLRGELATMKDQFRGMVHEAMGDPRMRGAI